MDFNVMENLIPRNAVNVRKSVLWEKRYVEHGNTDKFRRLWIDMNRNKSMRTELLTFKNRICLTRMSLGT